MAYDRFRFRGHDVIMHDSSQTAARDSGENGDEIFSLFKFNFNSFIANWPFYRELTAVARVTLREPGIELGTFGDLFLFQCRQLYPWATADPQVARGRLTDLDLTVLTTIFML